jgi:hypothetical protein
MSYQNEKSPIIPATTQKPAVVFQLWEGEAGIFVEKETYARNRDIQHALDKAVTWRDLERLLPDGEFDSFDFWLSTCGEYVYKDGEEYRFIDPEEIDKFMQDYGERFVIKPDDPYCKGLLGVFDGYYPDWLYQTAEEILPKDFVERFGTGVGGPVSGAWIEYQVSDLMEMVDALRASGFVVMAHLSYDLSWWRQIDLAS